MKFFGREYSARQCKDGLRFFLYLNFGLFLTAVGVAVFKTPNHFALGGTSGASILLATLFPQYNVSAFMWLINAVLVILGLVFLDRGSIGWTVYSSFALSAYVTLCQHVWPLSAPLTSDKLLELIFAVMLPAVGSAIVFNIGASTGGTDILAMILSKYSSMEIGKALMVSDGAIVLLAAWLYGPATGLYCVLGLVMKAFVVDGVIENINMRKVCTVISTKPDEILDFLVKKLNRSATVQSAYGAYTHEKEKVLVTVLTRHQAAQLRIFLRAADPKAFITIVNSSEIIGKGFRSI
jgi:uncharacterized membrane-anchored protein YitT (DUF2179 family)